MSQIVSQLRGWFQRLAGMFRKLQRDAEFAAELESHLHLHMDDNLRNGMKPEAARRDALIKLGGVEQVKETYRDQRGLPFLESALQDLRFAIRMLHKSPGFTTTAVLTLALAIGVSTSVFSVIYAMLLRPLPYNHPDRVFYLQTYSPSGYTQPASYPEYVDWRHQNNVFSALAAYNDFGGVNFEGPTGPVALNRVTASDNFFEVFGVTPFLGRTFAPGEDRPGKNDVAVLSYEVWREYFQSARDAVGKTFRLDGRPYAVIGVMPAGFRFPISLRNAIYTPLHPATREQAEGRGSHWLPTIALLKTGVSEKQAEADMARILDDLGKAYPGESKGRRMHLQSIAGFVVGNAEGPLVVLLFAVLALLAVGCVNIAGLLLSRGVKREREMALRSAMGASRGRIVRQSLTEVLLLAVLGGFAGVFLSYLLLKAIQTLLVGALSRGAEVEVNLPVMLAALGIAALVGVAAAIVPSLRLSQLAPNFALKVGGTAGTSRGQHRLRAAFVVIQVALALVLLVTSGLLLRVLAGLRSTELGFSPDHLHACEIGLSQESYRARGDVLTTFYRPLLERVAAIPGVKSAGLVSLLPLREWGWNGDTHIAGQPPNPQNQESLTEFRVVTSGYFDALGISLVKGRFLDPRIDTPTSPPTVVVNEAFVRKFLPNGEDPIGKHIDTMENAEIVGVVTNIRQNVYAPPMAEMDFDLAQVPPDQRVAMASRMYLLVRTDVEPGSITTALRGIFHDLDPGLPFRQPSTMRQVIDDVLTFEHLENWLFGTFAALALLLAMVGVYGLVSHEVELGTRDIGVRMALGATPTSVVASIGRRVALMQLGGLAVGLLLTAAGHKLLAAVIILHPAKDAAVISLIAGGLLLTGILAALIPARRAIKVDPMTALRYE